MPSVLQRFERPPVHDIDPSLVNGVNFGFAESHKGGDYVLDRENEGSFGLLSPHDTTENTDREAIDQVTSLVELELDNSRFNVEDPEASLRNIFEMAQVKMSEFAESQEEGYRSRFDMTLAKVFVDPADGELKLAYGSIGRHWIMLEKPNQSMRNLSKELDEHTIEQGIGIPPTDTAMPVFDVIPFNEAEQLLVLSRNAAGYSAKEGYTEKELKQAFRTPDLYEATGLLIKRNDYINKTALMIRAPYIDRNEEYDDGLTGWQRVKGRFSRNRQNRREGSNDDNNRRAGILGGAAVLAAMASRRDRDGSSRWSLRRNRNQSRDDDDVYVADDGTTRVVDNRGSVLVDQETRRRGGAKRAILLGALAVGSVLALRYGVDLGDDISNWIGDRPDTGVDVWPFGDGDLDDGNGNGWDLNPTNENLDRNDDPVNESFRDTGGFDVLPPFFDGDWFSLNEGLNVDLPNAEGEPNIDIDNDGDVDAPDATVNTPERLLDAPEATTPGGEAPDRDPPAAAPEPVPAPPVWSPDMFTVENGNGMILEIHQIGHEIVGDNFNNDDAMQVYEAVRAEYGAAALELPNHAGSDLYQSGNELRISAPGQAHWASQEIENFVYEKMREVAAA